MLDSQNNRAIGLKSIADYMDRHPNTVKRLIVKGEIPAVQIGRIWEASKEDLDRIRQPKNFLTQ